MNELGIWHLIFSHRTPERCSTVLQKVILFWDMIMIMCLTGFINNNAENIQWEMVCKEQIAFQDGCYEERYAENKPCQWMGVLACRGAASHAQIWARHSVLLPWPLQALAYQMYHLPVTHSNEKWTQLNQLELGPANSQAVLLLIEQLKMT